MVPPNLFAIGLAQASLQGIGGIIRAVLIRSSCPPGGWSTLSRPPRAVRRSRLHSCATSRGSVQMLVAIPHFHALCSPPCAGVGYVSLLAVSVSVVTEACGRPITRGTSAQVATVPPTTSSVRGTQTAASG